MLGKVEELKLIALCTLGDDRRAFGKLVEAYQDVVRQFLLNLTLGDAALTDDLAQETFLKAYMNVRSFKGLSKFSTWLYRIAYNEFCAWSRKRREERMAEDSEGQVSTDDASDYYDASGTESYSNAESIEAKMDVASCMKTLSEQERTVVTLFYIQDYPIKKIMEITSMPEGTVKSHLRRAKEKMSRLLRH